MNVAVAPLADARALHRLAVALGVAGAGLADQSGRWLAFGSTSILPNLPALSSRDRHVLEIDGTTAIAVSLTSDREAMHQWLVVWTDRTPDQEASGHLLSQLELLAAQLSLARVSARADAYRTMWRRAAQTARLGFWACELPDNEIEWSEGVYELFDLPAGEVVARSRILEMYTSASRQEMEARRREAIETGGTMSVDAEILTATGAQRWIRITGTVDVDNGRPVRIFGIKQDITEEKLLAQRTRRLANTDPMTGLANRSRFQSRLEARVGALLLVDLDGFKAINDTLGHAAGDACLIETARRMAECCGPGAMLARIGGDEFAVILDDARPETAVDLAERIVAALQEPQDFGGIRRKVTASVGIAYGNTCMSDDLYNEADRALYAAKHSGRNTWRDHTRC